jgi:hypothetical protein
MTNFDNVAFTSTLAIDKIARYYSQSFVPADAISRTYTVGGVPTPTALYRLAHGTGRPLACDMVWSQDNSVYLDSGVRNSSGRTSIAFSDSTYIYLFPLSIVDPSYYKIWALWPDDWDSTNPSVEVENYTDLAIQFDSRENYQKIYKQGKITFTAGTFGAQETQSITHPLGYIPNAKVWFEAFTGELWPVNAGGALNPYILDDDQDECQVFIDNNSVDIRLTKFSGVARSAHYRVFYDRT